MHAVSNRKIQTTRRLTITHEQYNPCSCNIIRKIHHYTTCVCLCIFESTQPTKQSITAGCFYYAHKKRYVCVKFSIKLSIHSVSSTSKFTVGVMFSMREESVCVEYHQTASFCSLMAYIVNVAV